MQNIAAALVKAQRQFGPALKTSTNPHFRSKYADLAACVEAVIDGLNANGIALMQPTHECGDGIIVETLFVHESGETMSAGRLHVPAVKADPQGYGSALTYARRYSLMAACGIAPEDDDGNAASKPTNQRAKADQTPPQQEWSAAHDAMLESYRGAAMEGTESLKVFHGALSASATKAAVWAKHGASLKSAAMEADHATAN